MRNVKVTTVREMTQKDGTKTTITIEENLNDADLTQLDRHLELVGFYDTQGVMTKVKRIFNGKGL